jgi:hypothetical protein
MGLLTWANEPVDGTIENAENVYVGSYYDEEKDRYMVQSGGISAKNMADRVYLRVYVKSADDIFYSDLTSYSPKQYAMSRLEKSDSEEMKALCVAMLNYGAAAQLHFGYNTSNLANSEIPAPDFSGVTISGFNTMAGQGTDLAKLYSASLILKGATTLRFFFQVESGASFTATYNGQVLAVSKRSGLYYVDVLDIAAKDLDEDVTITICDGINTADVTFNPMAYCQGVHNDTSGAFNQATKNLVAALYLYNQAANNYFQHDQEINP